MGFSDILVRRLTTVVLVFIVVFGLWWAGRPDPEPIGCFAWQQAVMDELQSEGADDGALEDSETSLGASRPPDCGLGIGPMYQTMSSECRVWLRTVQAEGRGYRGLGSEERSLAAAIRSNAASKPEDCPLPTHL